MQIFNKNNGATKPDSDSDSSNIRAERLRKLRSALAQKSDQTRSQDETGQSSPERTADALKSHEALNLDAYDAQTGADPSNAPDAPLTSIETEGPDPAPAVTRTGTDTRPPVAQSHDPIFENPELNLNVDETPRRADHDPAPERDTAPHPVVRAQKAAALISQLRARASTEADPFLSPEPDQPETDLVSETASDDPQNNPVDAQSSDSSEQIDQPGPEPEQPEYPKSAVDAPAETLSMAEPADLTTDPQPDPPRAEDVAPSNTPGPVSVPSLDDLSAAAAPSTPTGPKRPGRANKTRLLGFDLSEESTDLFANVARTPDAATSVKFPTGWIVVIDGPGTGESFALGEGAAQIGRGEGQGIRLDFGDTSISRENHAAIAYDPDTNEFMLAQGGKANLVRLNGRPVLTNEPLNNRDDIRIGQTTLRLIALCDSEFKWNHSVGGKIDD